MQANGFHVCPSGQREVISHYVKTRAEPALPRSPHRWIERKSGFRVKRLVGRHAAFTGTFLSRGLTIRLAHRVGWLAHGKPALITVG